MWEPARRDRRSRHAELASAAADVVAPSPISEARFGSGGRRLSGAFRAGWILNPGGDLVWFVALPFVALGIAFGFQHWLPYVAVASINLWITIPHHYATWVRTYGMPEEWERFRDRLIIGPVVIFTMAAVGYVWAPITLLLLVTAWDHQHSIMQQHGFGRVYDFKAGTGTPTTGRFDLTLHWILYATMLINAPMFRHLWIRELYKMRVPLSAGFVDFLTMASWVVHRSGGRARGSGRQSSRGWCSDASIRAWSAHRRGRRRQLRHVTRSYTPRAAAGHPSTAPHGRSGTPAAARLTAA